jgi:hypothetical protein
MRRACKRDSNHAELTGYLQTCGWAVYDTSSVGPNAIPGFPDALAVLGDGLVVAVEFKVGKAELTPDEVAFREVWRGAYEVVRNMDDVLDITRKYSVGRL